MDILKIIFIFIYSYLAGSIPFGLLLVRIKTGQDIRNIASGRTGGTNAGRAAGVWTGVLTAFLDGTKAATTVWISQAIFPQTMWLHVFAPILSIIGHNYSIFLIQKTTRGKLVLGGGAGGAPCAGGSTGLWFPSFFIVVPIAVLILYIGGYASIATLSIALLSIIIFTIRAVFGFSPWQYIVYGVIAELLLIWALRPNIKRLIEGNERIVGLRARKKSNNPPD
jgi:glycerol-3-phosphate acyltransferase PlsY